MSSCRVLIVTTEAPDLTFSGLAFFNKIFWQELKSRHYDFRTLYLNNQNKPHSKIADYEISLEGALPFDSTPESDALNKAWTVRSRIQPLLDEYKPDIISAHENWAALPFFFEMDKVQFTMHASYIGMKHYLARTQKGLQHYWEQRIAVKEAKAVILHSHWARKMVQDYVTADPFAEHIFPIGLKFSDYPSRKIPHPEGKLVVSFFGRLNDSSKNFLIFQKAVMMLPPDLRSRIEPRIYGPGPFASELLSAGFKGLNYVQGQAKYRAFAETDIVVMPSELESFGIVGLEALLSNCTLIATPGLGMDMYMPQECGCAPQPEMIRNRILDYIRNIDELRNKQDSQFYRKSVLKPEFSVEQMTDHYIRIWEAMYSANQGISDTNNT